MRLIPAIGLLLLLLPSAGAEAAERKQWTTLNNCRYVEHSNNDGDSFRLRCGSEQLTLRLYFVDAPETNLSYGERARVQSEHFATTLDETLKAGVKAREFVRDALKRSFVVVTRKAIAPGRGGEARYYGAVEVGNKGLDELLVGQGLARAMGVAATLPSGEKAAAHMDRLRALEKQARRERRGVWAGSRKR